MGIAERKKEEKQEMHQRILNGARKIFLEKGYEKASMRNIAGEINYSPGSLYFHFKDKTEIFQELNKEGFSLLVSKLKVLNSVADPFERLKATGRVFIQFSQENRDYYNLMFMVKETVNDPTEARFKIGEGAINHLRSVIIDCQEQGRFKNMDTDYFTFMILSTMHGICAMFCKDCSPSFVNKTNEELTQNGYECFVALLEKS